MWGGILLWFVYYENCEGGYFDIRRDKMNYIFCDIKDWNISCLLLVIFEVCYVLGVGGMIIL